MISRSVVMIALLGTILSIAPAPSHSSSHETLVFEQSRNDWFKGNFVPVEISLDASWALIGRGAGNMHLFSLQTGHEENTKLVGGFDGLEDAAFCGRGTPGIARYGRHETEHSWFLPGTELEQVSGPTSGAMLACSSDGSLIAYFDSRNHNLHLVSRDYDRPFSTSGAVTAMTFSADGGLFYYTAIDAKGQSTLSRISVATGETKVIADQLDGSAQRGQIALSPDGKSAYVALASDKAPIDSMRHQPRADRWLKIYKMNLDTGSLQAVVDTPGYDNMGPVLANGSLYWTRSVIRDSVVTLPSEGGAAKELVDGGMLPMWHPSGTKIGYYFGDFRSADAWLDTDDAVVGVNAEGTRTAEPSVIVSGYHEDFSLDWSPDGKWIAFHSHRSPGPVPLYRSPGSTDDVYLRRADDLHAPEIRLTDFGQETGPPSWSPDGKKLLMVSEQRDGTPGIEKVWELTMDTEKGAVLKTEMLALPKEIRSVPFAAWSPDGTEIALEDIRGGGKHTLWIVRADGSHPQKVVDYEGSTFQGLDWSRDGKSIVYSGLAGDLLQLFSISREGGTPRQLTHDSANLLHPRVSPDGRRIACSREMQMKQIWRLPLS